MPGIAEYWPPGNMKNYLLLFFAALVTSCSSPIEKQIETSFLLAGDNRPELEKVLAHYRNDPADSLKYRAAQFLIVGMQTKYSQRGPALDEFHRFLDSVYQFQMDKDLGYFSNSYVPELYENFRKTAKHQSAPLELCPDLRYITAEYLIGNIELAFEAWRKPWAGHVSFEDFCEFILPYRIGNEILENWRPLYIERFGKMLDDSMPGTAKEAGRLIINHFMRENPIHVPSYTIRQADIRPGTLLNLKFGMCEDYIHMCIFTMRALGIPAVLEYIPSFERDGEIHSLGAILDSDGRILDFAIDDQMPGQHLLKSGNHPKIYRKTYVIQDTSLAMICGGEEIPKLFMNPCMIDVTGNYPQALDLANAEFDIPKGPDANKFVYLCVFNDKGWRPVAWSGIKGQKARFENFSREFIYQLAFYESSQFKPSGFPFEVDSTGKIQYIIPDTTRRHTMYLDRKFRHSHRLVLVPESMIGGRIEAADNSSFTNARTLYTIDSTIDFKYRTVEVDMDKPYQYYRYISSGTSRGSMAEMEFYDKQTNKMLKGEIFGSKTVNTIHPDSKPGNVFDGDPLTFYMAGEFNSQAGLKLDKPHAISKVRFIIRNDDNGIRKGNSYELFYAGERGWESVGAKQAIEDDLICFENAPSGALYWLRNYTRGKEERIFLYEGGKQIWK